MLIQCGKINVFNGSFEAPNHHRIDGCEFSTENGQPSKWQHSAKRILFNINRWIHPKYAQKTHCTKCWPRERICFDYFYSTFMEDKNIYAEDACVPIWLQWKLCKIRLHEVKQRCLKWMFLRKKRSYNIQLNWQWTCANIPKWWNQLYRQYSIQFHDNLFHIVPGRWNNSFYLNYQQIIGKRNTNQNEKSIFRLTFDSMSAY